MDISQLTQIPWWAAFGGYVYALFYGHLLIGPIMERTHDIVDPGRPRDPQWQPFMTGIVERTLYVSSLLVGEGGFIVIWITLKMALQYRRWTGETTDRDEVLRARQRFMSSLNGNGLSIIHAFIGFLVIHWLRDGEYYRVVAAVVISALVWALSVIALDFYIQRGSNRPDE